MTAFLILLAIAVLAAQLYTVDLVKGGTGDHAIIQLKNGGGEPIPVYLGRRPGETPSQWGDRMAKEAIELDRKVKEIR